MSYLCEGSYDVYDERLVRARKAHACSACAETIDRGQSYARVGMVWEGVARSLKRCARCQRLHEHLRELGDADVWPDERLRCGLRYEDEWGAVPDEIAALAFWLPGDE